MNADKLFMPSDPDPKPEEAINIDIIAPADMHLSLSQLVDFERALNRRERQRYHSKRMYRVYPHGTIIVGFGFWQVIRNTWYQLLLRRVR